ncbi:phosphopantetheine-binding protein [Micromonospora sp. DR5-3]|uniref:acyl carrier protein n=1 Tax=unclassified Micromonospora TaxID=2617518 RepID=UPI0011DA5855|nr:MULTISPECIES: phosphopantetheine-binding protein [unclassified Micromonospora]MCW3819858.1 phosphopantetheine-binding protein [Micromonospora sp. DR5-3]TYC19915.1 acyl carrier protein [Micromonospora sp. MP36]
MSLADEITRYVVSEYLPGTSPEELDPSYDLIDTGVVDSLRLLQLIAWLGERYRIPIDDMDISPENFQSVAAMTAFVTTAQDHAALS